MGIQGLLIALKPYYGACSSGNVRDYTGQAVAVDTSSWLHKSVYSIADHYVECIEKGGQADAKCITTSSQYVIKRCQELLQYAGIAKIYLVLDGKRCPLKAVTNQERERKRRESLEAARKYRSQNKRDQMYEKYKACIKVTDQLAEAVVAKVRQKFSVEQVEIVWSPYEADAQLVQMCADRRCAAVITEDSDVLVYSAATQVAFPILYKLDRSTGACDVVSMDWLLNANQFQKQKANTAQKQQQQAGSTTDAADGKTKKGGESGSQLEAILDVFASRQTRSPGWGARLFVQACVLAGCDYAPRQLQGVGLVTAFKYVRNAGMTGSPASLSKLFHQILFSQLPVKSRGAVADLAGFEELLAQCESVFFYHPVVTASGKVLYLNDPYEGAKHTPSLERFNGSLSFLGNLLANRNTSSGIIPEKHQPSQFFHSQSKRKVNVAQTVQPQSSKRRNHRNSYSNTLPTRFDGLSYATSLTSPSAAPDDPPVSNIMSVSKMTNPYQQRRKPLQPYSPNIAKQQRTHGSLDKKLNPFEVYARRHREEGIENSNKIVTAKLPVRSKERNKLDEYRAEDVRYVKRSFPMDGITSFLSKQRDFSAPQGSEQGGGPGRHNSFVTEEDDPFGVKEATKRRRSSRSRGDQSSEVSYPAKGVATHSTTTCVDKVDAKLEIIPSTRLQQKPVLNFSIGMSTNDNDVRVIATNNETSTQYCRTRSLQVDNTENHSTSRQERHPPPKTVSSPCFDYENSVESPDLLSYSKTSFELSPNLLKYTGSEGATSSHNLLSSDKMFDSRPYRAIEQEEAIDQGYSCLTSVYFNTRNPVSNQFLDHNFSSRRVTLETPPEKVLSIIKSKESTHFRQFPSTGRQPVSANTDGHLSRQFNAYGDEHLPSPAPRVNEVVDLCDDDNEETFPSNWELTAALTVKSRLSQQPPKAKTTIGPAKTLRFRFGSLPVENETVKSKKKSGILQRVFKRQRSLLKSELSLRKSGSSRAQPSREMRPAKRPTTDPNQTTLLTHFSTRARHPVGEDA